MCANHPHRFWLRRPWRTGGLGTGGRVIERRRLIEQESRRFWRRGNSAGWRIAMDICKPGSEDSMAKRRQKASSRGGDRWSRRLAWALQHLEGPLESAESNDDNLSKARTTMGTE